MTRYRRMYEGEDGWSEWVQPRHNTYQMMCCDCGLVHELQFGVVKGDRASEFVNVEARTEGKVIFRARRNVRATAASRRRKR